MNRSHKGVALLLTLLVAFFLLVLLGAFLVVNRSNSSLTVSGLKRQGAYNVCMSGLHYVWAELESNQAWGSQGFPSGTQSFLFPPASPKVEIRVYGEPDEAEDLSKNYIEGRVLASGDSFRLTLVNNLQSRHIREESPLGRVPGHCAKVEIRGSSEGISLKLESILRKKPFVDYSALSSDNMSVELPGQGGSAEQAWRLRSKDPYINQIRSNAEILGPSAIESQLLFKEPPRGGVAKATEDILLDGTSVESDSDFRTQSERTARGTFQVGTAEIDVPDLSRDDMRFPTESISIAGGEIKMRTVDKHVWTSQEFVDDTGESVTRWRLQKVRHQAVAHNENLWVGSTGFPVEDSGPLHGPADGFPSPTSPEGFQDLPSQPSQLNDFPVLFGTEPEHQLRANLQTGQLALSSGTTFQVQGTLSVSGAPGALQPHLLFGYSMDETGVTDFTAGSIGNSALEEPEANSAALVSSGSLYIDGIATGFGSIFSEQNVLLQAKSGLRAEPDMAVAVHGAQIVFEADEPPDRSNANFLLDADWDFFKDAMNDTGFAAFDEWLEVDSRSRRSRIGDDPELQTGLRNSSIEQGASSVWNELAAELDLGPAPNFSASPFGSDWSGNLNLDKYVRLREFAKTGDNSWLEMPGPRFQSVLGKIDAQIGTYSQWATRMDLSMEDFMAADRPEIADVFFVGLVHAGLGGFHARTNGSSLLIEGSVVSQGKIEIEEAPTVDFVYNRLYLDEVVKRFREDHIELDQVYYKLN